MFYILNQEDTFILNDNEALDNLNLISSYTIYDENILLKIENNDSNSKEIINQILSGKDYELDDITNNQTILSKHTNDYKNSISAKKVIGEHEFRLTLYS